MRLNMLARDVTHVKLFYGSFMFTSPKHPLKDRFYVSPVLESFVKTLFCILSPDNLPEIFNKNVNLEIYFSFQCFEWDSEDRFELFISFRLVL